MEQLTQEQSNDFAGCMVHPKIERALSAMNIHKATPVQEKSLPVVLSGRDVVVQAPTGTGKTFAFGIPLLSSIDTQDNSIQGLVLCPTRELAMQTAQELIKLSKFMTSLRIISIYGGQPINRQIMHLKKKPQIVIATPGRLLDHIRRRTIRLHNTSFVVLDEADEMLNMGFRNDIDKVLSNLPGKHQTALFSATMPKEIMGLINTYLNKPETIKIKGKKSTLPKITQNYVEVAQDKKIPTLTTILRKDTDGSTLIFCNTKRMVDRLAIRLSKQGLHAEGLHGDMRQNHRDRVISNFKSGKNQILVATDVAARGIDVSGIGTVFNYDVPRDTESYIHRIGRTGRAEKKGVAYTLIVKKDKDMLYRIMDHTKQKIHKIKVEA